MKLGDSSHDFLFESSIFRERQTKFTSILEHTNLQTRMAFFIYINLKWKLIHYKVARELIDLQAMLLYLTIMRYYEVFATFFSL